MPELPEVESVRRKLEQVLAGKTIAQLTLLREKTFPDFALQEARLLGQQIQTVERRAKILRFVLARDYDLLAHLKMTGQFIYQDRTGHKIGGGHPTADWVNQLPSKHTRFIFDFSDQSRLYFNDMRVFGWLKLYPKEQVTTAFAHLGPDILSAQEVLVGKLDQASVKPFTDYLLKLAKRRLVSIKQFIMDNQVLCGVGNIYASEALFQVGISPLRPAKAVSAAEMRTLVLAMKKIVLLAIKLGGTTFDGKYVDISGFAGHFQEKLKVYGQEGRPCSNCGTSILRIKQGGRSSFYCPACQK